MGLRALAVGFLGVVALAPGCARSGGVQIGGEIPEEPVAVIGSDPENLAVVPPFGGPVRIRFERTLSERPSQGSLADAVIVSPRTGEVSVSAGRGGVEVNMEGGFRTPALYRVTVLPVFQDRFNNRMADRYELIFSTGPEMEPNLLAGIVSDRITLAPEAGIRVDAVPPDESPIHSTVSDSLGIFTFPYLAAGRYTVVAYDDLNRNREPDFSERQGSLDVGVNFGDTLIVTELPILAPDTTAAVLDEVAVLDSLALRLLFDDHLAPELEFDEVEVRLLREGANAPEVVEVLRRPDWDLRNADPDLPTPAGPVLPDQELVAILSRPLLPELDYRLEVEGVVNLHGIPGGGGAVDFQSPPEPPAPPPDVPPAGDPAPGDPPPGDALPDIPIPG